MEQQSAQAPGATLDFRRLVQNCAREAHIVESFNRACGAQLEAPIRALLDDPAPLPTSEEEQLAASWFIVFVHTRIWSRMQRAPARVGWSFDADSFDADN